MFKEMLIEWKIVLEKIVWLASLWSILFCCWDIINNCFYLTVNYFECFSLGIVTWLQYTASSEQAKVYKLPCHNHVFVKVSKN